MAATQLVSREAEILIVDQKAAPARKFLVAGDGGFNLTHSEELDTFLQKYDSDFVRNCVKQFTPEDFRQWLSQIGIETFVGSSGKVFPVVPTKPIEVLNAWRKVLKSKQLSWKMKTKLVDFDESTVTLECDGTTEVYPFDFLVLATGGASWKKTGTDGKWLELFEQKAIVTKPFSASNSGVVLKQVDYFPPRRISETASLSWLKKHEGTILKNVRVTAGDNTVPGDVVITSYGLEGKPIYAANSWLRQHEFSGLSIDFRPQLTVDQVITALHHAKNVRSGFDKLKLPVVVYDWLKEVLSKEEFTDALELGRHIKAFKPEISGFRPIDEVISTVGGVEESALSETGELMGFPQVYCAGEMVDWDAPTGGYLIQACVSMGFVVGTSIRKAIDN